MKYVKEDFEFGRILGEGAFSRVFLAKLRSNTSGSNGNGSNSSGTSNGTNGNQEEFAVKVVEKKQILKLNKLSFVKNEKQVLHKLNHHPNIINLFCTFQDSDYLYFVLELAPGGELFHYFHKFAPCSLLASRFYAAEIVNALEYMHSLGVLHRDLKPENILLDRGMHVKITDFGTAKIKSPSSSPIPNPGPSPSPTPTPVSFDPNVDHNTNSNNNNTSSSSSSSSSASATQPLDVDDPDMTASTSTFSSSSSSSPTVGDGGASKSASPQSRQHRQTFCGTAEYVSPEVLKDSQSSESSDLWALGCIIYQMLTGHVPFRADSEYLVFRKILSCDFTFPPEFPLDARDLITRLLNMDPTKRLGMPEMGGYSELKAHPFFTGINFDRIIYDIPPPLGDPESAATRKISKHSSSSGALDLQSSQYTQWERFLFKDENVVFTRPVLKRRGFSTKKRQLVLTDFPRLIYIDPVRNELKGEIQWSQNLKIERKSPKEFCINTPKRAYQIEDLNGEADKWVAHIVNMVTKSRNKQQQPSSQ